MSASDEVARSNFHAPDVVFQQSNLRVETLMTQPPDPLGVVPSPREQPTTGLSSSREARDTTTEIEQTIQSGPRPLPCPFCGADAYVYRSVNGEQMFKVGCSSCGVELKAAWYRGEDTPTKDILALWNTRAALPAPPLPEAAAPQEKYAKETAAEVSSLHSWAPVPDDDNSRRVGGHVLPTMQASDDGTRQNEAVDPARQVAASLPERGKEESAPVDVRATLSDPDKVTRFEVIDEHGRALVRHDCRIELSYQDNGRTLKVFLADRSPSDPTGRILETP